MVCFSCGNPVEGDACSCGGPALLDGRYRLQRVLGQGTSGATWQGVEVASGEAVAIKEMPLRQAETLKARELLDREARVLRELDHPGIPRWRDAIVSGHGRFRALYLVQELVRGRTLAEEMKEKRYTIEEILFVADELLGILAYLHGLSPPVVHRDLKPGNVMRREDGRIALVDFGAVRDVLKGELGGSTVAGTFGYMAPEQFHGDAWPVTDLYGLGALLVALLSRREPQGMLDSGQRLAYAAHVEAPPELRRLLDRLLAPEIADRPVSAAHVRGLLRALREVGLAEKEHSPAAALFDPVDLQLPARPSSGLELVRARREEQEAGVYRLATWVAGAALALSTGLGAGGWATMWWMQPKGDEASAPQRPDSSLAILRILEADNPAIASEYFRAHVVEENPPVASCFSTFAEAHPEHRYADVRGWYDTNRGYVGFDLDGLDDGAELDACLDVALQTASLPDVKWPARVPFVVTIGFPASTPDEQAFWALLYDSRR